MNRTFISWPNHFVPKPRLLIFASLVMVTYTSLAQEAIPIPQLSGGTLKLDNVARLTLANSSAIKSQSLSKDTAKSSLQVQRGTFNVNTFATLNSGRNRPHYMEGLDDDDNQGVTVGASKLFRSGISSDFSVTLGRDKYFPGTEAVDTQNNSTVSFNVNIPLLKGRGATSAAADETAAQLANDAAVQTYYDTISQTLLAAIVAYWDYKGAVETLKALQGSKQRVSGWVTEAQKGAEATGNAQAVYDKFSSQISRLKAYLSNQERKVSDAANLVTQTKMALAVAMGIPSDQMKKIGEPTEVFLTNWGDVAKNFDQDRAMQKWIADALEKRFDLRAAKLNEQATATQLAKARQDLLPQLDLGLNAGRTGYENGSSFSKYTAPLTASGESRGTNLGITLNLSYALGNDTAQGLLGIAAASHQQSLLDLNELTRNVNIEVATSVEVLANSLQVVEQARQSVLGYQPSLDKYKSGQQSLVSDPAVLFNLMDIEKDLVEAMVSHIQSLLDLAKTIVTVRYKTGSLIEVNPTTNEATLKNISSLPEL